MGGPDHDDDGQVYDNNRLIYTRSKFSSTCETCFRHLFLDTVFIYNSDHYPTDSPSFLSCGKVTVSLAIIKYLYWYW